MDDRYVSEAGIGRRNCSTQPPPSRTDTTRSFNKRIQTLEPRHFETQANMALNSVRVPRPAASGFPTSRFELGTELKICPTSICISLR